MPEAVGRAPGHDLPPRPVHGGARPDQLRAGVIDFSASINPYAPPPGLRRALATVNFRDYPDPTAGRLIARLASVHNVGPEYLLVGNGSAELIFLIARALLGPGKVTVVVGPAFGEYAYASTLAGAAVVTYTAPEATGFVPELPELTDLVGRTRPAMVWVANPANPTGIYLPAAPFGAILAACDGVLVIDEAFRSFVEGPWPSEQLLATGRVLLLRSLTKDFGLAGLRLGYLLGPPELVDRVRAYQPPWSVNALAQAAGEFILTRTPDFMAVCRRRLGRRRRELQHALQGLGLWVSDSAANFLLVKTGAGAACAQFLLERHRLLVRDCTSFGLPDHVRVAIRRRPENRRLVAGLADWVGSRAAGLDTGPGICHN